MYETHLVTKTNGDDDAKAFAHDRRLLGLKNDGNAGFGLCFFILSFY